MLLNGIHALMDQEYSGDINIVPSFRWYKPTKILSHLSEAELLELMDGGEHSCFPNIESIRLCTKISRTMEEILHRFEYGDLRPDASEYHRPRASRRRPPATRSDREAMRVEAASRPKAQAKPKAKPKAKKAPGKRSQARKKPPAGDAKGARDPAKQAA